MNDLYNFHLILMFELYDECKELKERSSCHERK